MDKKKRLELQIEAKEKQNEKNKTKRTITTIAIIAVVIYIVFFIAGIFESPFDYLLGALGSVVGAAMALYFGILLFALVFMGNKEEDLALYNLKKEYEKLLNDKEKKMDNENLLEILHHLADQGYGDDTIWETIDRLEN